MSAIDIDTVKHALRAWVIRGSGLSGDHVMWTLGARRPSQTFVHMRLHIGTVGQDGVTVSINPTPTPGNDAVYTAHGSRLLHVKFTCFAPEEPNQGARSPEQILNDVLTAYSLPSVNGVIKAARIAWLTNSDITSIGANIDKTLFEPRATVAIRMSAVASMSETGPAIDSVDIAGTTQAGETDFTVDISP